MIKIKEILSESFENFIESEREDPGRAYIFDQWVFDMDNKQFAVRFMADKVAGKKVVKVIFGVKRGQKIRSDIKSIQNIRVYLATILNVIEKALADPTPKMQSRMNGIILSMPVKYYDRYGKRYSRIVRMRLKEKWNIIRDYSETDDEKWKGIYLYRKGRNVDQVFSGIDFDKFIEDPYPVVKKVEAPIVIPVETSTPEEAEIEAIEVASSAIETRQNYDPSYWQAQSPSIKDIHVDNPEEFLIRHIFETEMLTGYDGESRAPDGYRWMDAEDRLKVLKSKYSGLDKKFNRSKFILAINLKGIVTGYHDDSLSGYSVSNVAAATFNISRPPEFYTAFDIKVNTSYQWYDVWKIYQEQDEIVAKALEAKGVSELKSVNKYYLNDSKIEPGRTIKGKTVEEDVNMLATLIQGASGNIPEEELYTFRESGEKKPKQMKVKALPDGEYSREIFRVIKDLQDRMTYNEFREITDRLPNWAVPGFYSENQDMFTIDFIQNWLISGGTQAYALAHKATDKLEVNDKFSDYFITNRAQDQYDINPHLVSLGEDATVKGHFKGIYDQTQAFFKEKLKKKYDGHKVKLYRGVALNGKPNSYSPATIESWTPLVSTAKAFAKMMAIRGQTEYVLYAEVPITAIFGTYESLTDYFVPEEELKGKKEYMVMGGIFSSVPIYEFDVTTKTTIGKIMESFKTHHQKKMIKEDKATPLVVVPKSKVTDQTATGRQEGEDDLVKVVDKRS